MSVTWTEVNEFPKNKPPSKSDDLKDGFSVKNRLISFHPANIRPFNRGFSLRYKGTNTRATIRPFSRLKGPIP